MRMDRFITLRLVHPLRGALNRFCTVGGQVRDRGKALPILMYHSVSNEQEPKVHPYYRLATTPHRFAEQMQTLADLGYTGVSLEEALTLVASGAGGIRPAAITFDDGFRDFYTAAWPVLRRHRFTATVYLSTAYIAEQRKTFHGKECLTWTEVGELHRQRVRFGSHTVNHPELYKLSWDEIERELALSKTQIEAELDEEITSFAYPYAFPQEAGAFTKRFKQLLRERGYQNCVTTIIGTMHKGDDAFALKRLPMNSCDDSALFAAKLGGAYDWLSVVQYLFRNGKTWIKPPPQNVDLTASGALVGLEK